MQLSSKAMPFVIEALEYRIQWYSDQLARDDLDDDTAADLSNDRGFLTSLLASIKAEAPPGT
jgi:hypothetical protein